MFDKEVLFEYLSSSEEDKLTINQKIKLLKNNELSFLILTAKLLISL
tara:strand:- start:150 stop:290 length:141 start_codon:yes stop_codon:yes gene_type:complete